MTNAYFVIGILRHLLELLEESVACSHIEKKKVQREKYLLFSVHLPRNSDHYNKLYTALCGRMSYSTYSLLQNLQDFGLKMFKCAWNSFKF